MKRTEYSKTFEVGKTAERKSVYVTVEVSADGGHERQTVTHEKVTEWRTLSLSGVVQGGGAGQIVDELAGLESYAPGFDAATVAQIEQVWRRWHLNDAKAGCVHQSEGAYSRPEIAGQICPVSGYKYGSAWLVDPLPAEVEALVRTWGASTASVDPYERQAREVLERFGLQIRAAFKGDGCPKWCNGDHVHGDRYRVTVKGSEECSYCDGTGYVDKDGSPVTEPGYPCPECRGTGKVRRSVSFDFWNSRADMEAGKRPSDYDILSTLGGDANAPTNPDEVAAEFGDMVPSRALAVAAFAKKLQAFFTAEELEALSEIR